MKNKIGLFIGVGTILIVISYGIFNLVYYTPEENEYSASAYYLFSTNNIGNNSQIDFIEIPKKEVPQNTNNDSLLDSTKLSLFVHAFYEEVFPEVNIEDWQVESITYATKCSDYDKGYDLFTYILFSQSNRFPYVYIRQKVIVIKPQYGYVEYYEISTKKPFSGLTGIDLSKINITPENAMKIADSHGGAIVRHENPEKCFIYIYGNVDKRNKGWEISYDGDNLQTLYTAIVDYQNGVILHQIKRQ